jgi:hypothetical protein
MPASLISPIQPGTGGISLIPPGTGGVRDYASMLSDSLGAPLLELAPHTDTAGFSGELLFLHFSGYGFQKRGVPTWLVDTVRNVRPRFDKVGIVFHELYAPYGAPWNSAFWLKGLQKRIARDLLALADFWITSREESARWLDQYSRPVPHTVMPVFSTVGELESVDTPRRNTLVVFGSPGVRTNVYEWANGEVFRCAKRNGLQIHDIGPRIQDPVLQTRLAEEEVVVRGKLPAEEVSAALGEASYGALAYPVDYVAKSSVFAAYCAHGLCPVLLTRGDGSYDGLVANQHYASGFGQLDAKAIRPALIGQAARAWYEPHRVSATQAAVKALAQGVSR